MDPVKVSIIIPMYNASRYVLETLESVRCQTYKNWEVLIVDDGSTDSSAEKVQEFVSKYPSVAKLLFHPNKENRGTSASRNLGLKLAQGELICFLDSDDVWEPTFLAFSVQVFDRHPEISMTYGPALFWHAGPGHSKDYVQRPGIKANRIIDANKLFKLFLVGDNAVPSPSGVMIRNKALFEVGGWEELFRGMYDDQVLYSKLLLSGISVFVSDQCLYRYRQHDESLCGTALKENNDCHIRKIYLEWLKKYLHASGRESLNIIVLITEQLWYIQRHKENEISPIRGLEKKIKALSCFVALLIAQKNFIFTIKLGWRIASQQILQIARTFKASRQ